MTSSRMARPTPKSVELHDRTTTAHVDTQQRARAERTHKDRGMLRGVFVPTKRNLLDKARAAQSLDGNRLTGSLLVPGPRLYSPDYSPTSEDNVHFASLANVVMPSLDGLLRATRRTSEPISAGLWSTSFMLSGGTNTTC